MTRQVGFIERHNLWTEAQREQGESLKRRVETENFRLIRLAWPDPHGCSRAKEVTTSAFLNALNDGYNINVATTTLDSANARTFNSFTRGGGLGLDEMTGSPNITIVPDPATFRALPWAPGVGWVLCDEYFNSGAAYSFSPRQLLKAQLCQLAERGVACLIGLEIEWYLLRLAEDHLEESHLSIPGFRGRPIATFPVEPGYSYHSESNFDLMQPVLTALAESLDQLALPLRSIENEWGPGQVECTFSPQDALQAADGLVLFRTATKQICRRMGYVATFMCRPALKGYYSSGWHLHQSLVEGKTGRNLFMPERNGAHLSPFGMSFLGGLINHAVESTVFTTPTVNGYRRFRSNSLAPDRASWGYDHRGAMLRVLGSPGDRATRIENRVGEPAANPYLYILSQIVSGMDGVENAADPGPKDDEPYTSNRALLPTSLVSALDALESSSLFRNEIGDLFVDYFVKLKRNEVGRYLSYLESETGKQSSPDDTTVWEQNEYFDFF